MGESTIFSYECYERMPWHALGSATSDHFYVALALATGWWQNLPPYRSGSGRSRSPLTTSHCRPGGSRRPDSCRDRRRSRARLPARQGARFRERHLPVVAIRYDGVQQDAEADTLPVAPRAFSSGRSITARWCVKSGACGCCPTERRGQTSSGIAGLRMMARRAVHVSISGNVRLIARPAGTATQGQLPEVRRAPERSGPSKRHS